MYIYNYRLFDRYERTVASLAVLADDAPGWRPAGFWSKKISVTRRLYRLGLDREQILAVYAFIDWVMALPEGLEIDYHNAVASLEEEQNMRYVTTAERIGMEKGERLGKAEGERIGEAKMLTRLLETRFGPLSDERRRQLQSADADSLLE